MIAGKMTLSTGLLLAALLPFTGCDKKDVEASNEPEFKSAAGETPDCCMPSDDTVARRDVGETNEPKPVEPSEVLASNSAELIARVGSIQTSVDEGLLNTIIGRKPDLDLTFKNEDGEEVNLARDYAGKTIVLSTIFTSCPTPTACPRITDDFADLANRLPADLAGEVRLVLVSFDVANDTPEVLKMFGRKHGLNFDRVDLLVSDVATTKRLMLDELDIPIEIDGQTGGFSNHALMVHIVNKDGLVVVERTAGSSAKISMLLDEVVRATRLPFLAPDNGG